MKIVMITGFPASYYNMGGPTSLPYQLFKHRPKGAQVLAFTFPSLVGRSESEIRQKYRAIGIENLSVLPSPKSLSWGRHMVRQKFTSLCSWFPFIGWRRKNTSFAELYQRFPVVDSVVRQIRTFSPDVVYLYPHWLINWAWALPDQNLVVTGPDSATLHHDRVIRFGRWTNEQLQGYVRQYRINSELEQAWSRTQAYLHFVGRTDLYHYQTLTGCAERSFFSIHPCCIEVQPANRPSWNDKKSLFHILVSLNDSVYIGDHFQRFISSPVTMAQKIKDRFHFFLLGHSGPEYLVPMRKSGWQVELVKWVDNYEALLSQMDIHLYPIAVGTGTKGKVLGSLCMGLLGIGSAFAYENIHVEPGVSCLQYGQPEEIISLLKGILDDPTGNDRIRRKGQIAINKYHAPAKAGRIFWEQVSHFLEGEFIA